jgi:uncharacterized Zn finger protein (UPF0148 family)
MRSDRLLPVARIARHLYLRARGHHKMTCPKCKGLFWSHTVTARTGGEQYQTGRVFCPPCAERDVRENPMSFPVKWPSPQP